LAGTDVGVFRSADAGATWTASSSGLSVSSVQALAVDASAPNVVYAGTPGGVFKSVDGGGTWTASSGGLDNHGVLSLAIDPSARDTLYAGTFSSVGSTLSGNGVYESHDGGATWSAANSGIEDLAVASISTDASGASVFAGTTAGVFRSARGSATWTGVNDGLPGGLVQAVLVDRVSSSTVYAGTATTSAFRVVFAAGAGSCSAGPTTLCLNGNRFQVEVAWRAANLGTAGPGMAVPLTGDTGAFWFFTSANVELVIKVVDGRPVNGAFWAFYGAMSDVEYTITVTDTATGEQKIYRNPQGTLASVADTAAF
jgi:ligand-binding sensor domain-containing protein